MKIKKHLFFLTLIFSICVFMFSCTNEADDPALSVDAVYRMACDAGYSKSIEEFISEFKGEQGAVGEKGDKGDKGDNGQDGIGIESATVDNDKHLILSLTNGETIDCGNISVATDIGITVGKNGNWHIDGVDTGYSALGKDGKDGKDGIDGENGKDGSVWHTGTGAPLTDLGNDLDLYFDTETANVYQKNNGKWSVIANIMGDGYTVVEGDDYNITVNSENSDVSAAAKGLLSSVSVTCVFQKGDRFVQTYYSSGSGIIYSLDKSVGDAYIITNFHVVHDVNSKAKDGISENIQICIYGFEYSDYLIKAEFVGGSMTHDIAVLKVEGNDLMRTSGVRPVEIADSSEVKVLDKVIAIGNAEARGISATVGSVSMENEYIELESMDNSGTTEYRVMRIDAAVNAGNSGGGLFNSRGELVGIVNAKEASADIDNMAYAIPSRLAIAVVDNIIRSCAESENTKMKKCVIGIGVVVDDISLTYDETLMAVVKKQNVVVFEVQEQMPASNALMVGDIIKTLTIDGRCFVIKNNYEVGETLLYATPDSTVVFGVIRGTEEVNVQISLSEADFTDVK